MGGQAHMSEFLMLASDEALESLRGIVGELVSLFGQSRAEAVARVNVAWGDEDLADGSDLLGREEPEHWAYCLYDEGDVAYGEPDVDRTRWPIRPAPSRDAQAWTLEPE